ncbi:MAG: type II toxin-antitoxin system VapC family toxin [Chloroflexi bacterium]|nr:type II toxin-antitoxin system VapC family toxin [Chloroflexota bacterium]
MNSTVCIDANLALKLVLPEADRPRVLGLWKTWLDHQIQVVAPPLFLYEGASAIRGQVYRGLLSAEEGELAFRNLRAQDIALLSPPEIHERA